MTPGDSIGGRPIAVRIEQNGLVLNSECPLRLIGYWASVSDASWPDSAAFVDPTWDDDERELVRRYLSHGLVARVYMGMSRCRFCSEKVGYRELTDGEYIWPEGLAHYVTEYQVRLPQDFIAHVHEQQGQFKEMVIDETWWREQTSP